MLADLFSDPNNENNQGNTYAQNSFNNRPPAKRKSINLSGIINQGATCYLNTLIQTLLLTKEFRESLFSLKPEELGLIPTSNGQTNKVRIIPIELQRLFAQLLILDQEACSTTRLTESFGWSNNEELQQHDIQELNRILFNAIEQSLVNTDKSTLIQELYRGTCVNKIKCFSCMNVFEREEEFLDLPITVQGSIGLHESLSHSFILRENLNGNNQYRCETCNNKYTDAEKYCQLKTLPPILTLSLLRFTYDLKTFQRIKETSSFEFPVEIDLNAYMEDTFKKQVSNEYTKYELFSIIIHSGSAYGGHYHTYIRDFDQIGKWEYPAKKPVIALDSVENTTTNENIHNNSTNKEVCLICYDDDESQSNQFSDSTNELVNLDYLKYETPLELLKAFIYNKHKYEEIKIDSMCADLTKITGQSWNKRFKNKYGTIEKFLRKNDENFELLNDNKYVKLKIQDRINIIASSQYKGSDLLKSCLNEVEAINNKSSVEVETLVKSEKITEEEEEKTEMKEKYHWFDFDDSKITPIKSSQIRKQFEGKESAYMLFYRRKSDHKKSAATSASIYKDNKIPEWLVNEVNEENLKLNIKRTEYDQKVNSFQLDCFLDTDFYMDQNILNIHPQFENKEFKLEINKQKTCLNDLKELFINYCTDNNNQSELNKDLQLRKESCLNMLLDDENKYYWLLCNRVDIYSSSSSSSSSSSTSRYNYFIKALLTDPNENLLQIIKKNSSKSAKSCLVLSKHNDIWPIGEEYEPIRILVKFEKVDINYTFTKCSLIKQVKEVLTSDYSSNLVDNMNLSSDLMTFNLLKFKNGKNEDAILLTNNEYDHKSLTDLSVTTGDIIIVSILSNNCNDQNEPTTSQPIHLQQDPAITYEVNVLNCLTNNATYKLIVSGMDPIDDLKIMSLSSFDLNEINSEQCQLRFIDDDLSNSKLFEGKTYGGICLHGDATLSEILNNYIPNEKQLTFILCPGRSPKKFNNEITIKCVQESIVSKHQEENQHEIVINLTNCRVIDLTNQLVDSMCLPKIENPNETYYLKTMDAFGDAESVLNNIEALCSAIPLKHNDCLLITHGRLVPINHYKIKVWTNNNNNNNEAISDKLEKCSINEQDEFVLNSLMDRKIKDFKLIEELIVKNELKLEDLKLKIQNLLIEKNDDLNKKEITVENLHIRLRVLKKINALSELNEPLRFQMKKCLFEMHKPLKQLHLVQENDIYVQVLDEEDTSINQGIILIDCCRFYLKKRLCSKRSYKQILWNTNNGATYSSLRDSILKAYSDELEPSDLFKISLAKYLIGKYQWILLKDNNNTDNGSLNCNNNSNNKKKKKKPNQQQQSSKSNLKSGPFNLDDGDLIVFTLDRLDDSSAELTGQHFMSDEDLMFNKKKNMTSAELSRLRKERKKESDPLGLGTGSTNKSNRRPEVGISIKIDDFNS